MANGFVFVSGQLPVRPDGTRLVDAPFEQQADMAQWPAFNALYARWAGACRPARAGVPCGALH